MSWFFKRRPRVERVLIRAREIIGRDGWCQGTTKNGAWTPGGACAAWAISLAAWKLRGDVDEAMALFADRNELPTVASYGAMTPTQRVTSWNDAEGRTSEEVVQAFRKAVAS